MYSVRFQIIKCQKSFLVMKGVNIVIWILQMTNISLLLGGDYSKYLLKNHVKVGQNNHQFTNSSSHRIIKTSKQGP